MAQKSRIGWFERLEDRRVCALVGTITLNEYDANLAGDEWIGQRAGSFETSPHRNPLLPQDINNDGTVTPLDALRIINFLNSDNERKLPTVDVPFENVFIDPSGDNNVAPLDVLLIINYLNSDDPTPLPTSWEETAEHAREPITLDVLAELAAEVGSQTDFESLATFAGMYIGGEYVGYLEDVFVMATTSLQAGELTGTHEKETVDLRDATYYTAMAYLHLSGWGAISVDLVANAEVEVGHTFLCCVDYSSHEEDEQEANVDLTIENVGFYSIDIYVESTFVDGRLKYQSPTVTYDTNYGLRGTSYADLSVWGDNVTVEGELEASHAFWFDFGDGDDRTSDIYDSYDVMDVKAAGAGALYLTTYAERVHLLDSLKVRENHELASSSVYTDGLTLEGELWQTARYDTILQEPPATVFDPLQEYDEVIETIARGYSFGDPSTANDILGEQDYWIYVLFSEEE